MGRDKDSSARKAGGRTAASSAAAAAMVAAMGAGGGLTFAAFDPNVCSAEQELDPDMALALKKLGKRDSTTKIKALGELLGFFEVQGGRTEDELALILPLWQQPFESVVIDPDRRVREALFVALGALVVRVKKHMTKHFRGLILPWLCARFDTEAPVRAAANAAFSALFPPAKIADALLYCKAEILRGIDANLAHTTQTLCDPKIFSKEEAEETIARVHSSSLLVLAHILEALSQEQALTFAEGVDALQKPGFWKLVTNSSVHVRAAFYTCIRAITLQAPVLIHDSAAADGTAKSKLKLGTAAVLQGLSDKDSAVHSQMWECILVLFRTFPSALAGLDLNKAVLPRLFTFVKSGAYGSAVESFPCLVPLADLCLQASPAVADKMHIGLLQSLWESLAALKEVRGGNKDERAATLRAYFECLIHGWQKCAVGGVEESKVTQRVEALTTSGLLPSIDALLVPSTRGQPVPGGRAPMLAAAVKCLELLCCRAELATARAEVLRILVARLQGACARLAGAREEEAQAAEMEEEQQKEEARELSALLCALRPDGTGREALLPVMSGVCQTLKAECWSGAGGQVRLPPLMVLCDLVAKWGAHVLCEDRAMQPRDAAATLLTGSVLPVIVSVLDGASGRSGHAVDVALPGDAKKDLNLVFRLAMLLVDAQGDVEPWTLVLSSVAGGSKLPSECARVEALAMLVQHAAEVQCSASTAQLFCCETLDKIVLDATVRLLLRQGHAEEPGMLLASKLHSLVVAVLPRDKEQGGSSGFLISDGALTRLIQRLTGVMQVWAGVSDSTHVEDDELVDGAQVTAAISSAAMAGLETVERVLLASQAALLPDACSKYVAPILGALFQLQVHSEDRIVGVGGDNASDRPLYNYGGHMSGRLRSTTGLRAYSLWDSCARAVLVDVLRKDGSNGLAWVMDRAKETSNMVHATSLVTEALVLGDLASEIIKVATACQYDVHSALSALLQQCVALPQGASTADSAGSMWLAFGLRFMHCLGFDTLVGLLKSGLGSTIKLAPMSWLFEEVVLAYSDSSVLKPAPESFSRCLSSSNGNVWSHSAVCGSGEGLQDWDEADELSDKALINGMSQDVTLAWSELVSPIIAGEVGAPHAGLGVSSIAHHLVVKCLQRTLAGCLQWPRALAHLLSLLARAGAAKYLLLCNELLDSFLSDSNNSLLAKSDVSRAGAARLALVLVKVVADVVKKSEDEVQRSGIGDRLVYCTSSTEATEEVELLAVHREEFPAFYSIRMADGREKQTEAHRLGSIPWLTDIAADSGLQVASVALSISILREKLSAVAKQCAQYVLQQSRAIRAALVAGQSQADSTYSVASLVLIALRELCRCRQHCLVGTEVWLDVLECSCNWFDTSRQGALPSPESSYMLSATAGLVMAGHDLGLDSEATCFGIAESLGTQALEHLDASIVSYWLAQLSAEPNGSCVRALCARSVAWAQLSARVHALIVRKAFWGSAAQGLAMQVLLLADPYAVFVPASAGGAADEDRTPGTAKAAAEGEDSDDEVVEVVEDDDDEVVEVVDEDDEDREPVQFGDAAGMSSSIRDLQMDAQGHWEQCRRCGFAHVLGEFISVRDTSVAGMSRRHLSRVRLLATVAAGAGQDVLRLALIHLERKQRQALCEALHSLLPATDVVVQTAAYVLLARFYTLPALLLHLDALEWEGLEPEQEEQENDDGERARDAQPSPSGAKGKEQPADLLRAIPAPLSKAMRTSADAAGQVSASASPGKAAPLAAAEAVLMSTESLGMLLAWLLVLEFRERCSARLQGNISAYLRNQALMQPLLSIAFAHVVSDDVAASPGGIAQRQRLADADLTKLPELKRLASEEEAGAAMHELAAHIVWRSIAAFPSLVRVWYNDIDRSTASRVDKFVAGRISPLILAREIAIISAAASSLDETGELSIRASSKTREITAAYTKDEAVLEVVLRVPPSYPLRPMLVDGTRRVGVSEGKWRKWVLAMRTLLDNKDGSLLDAVVLWKKNVDQVFEGVDECPICYTVLEREGLEDGGAHAARADALVALVAYDS